MPEPPEGAPNPMLDMMKSMMNAFHTSIENYGEEYAVYADKIKKWDFMKVMGGFMNVSEPMRCGFQVLNHGDSWVNNFMIKYDEENNPIDVLLIDFQMSFWGSPAIDLQYFFISSLQDDIKVDHFDDLIEHYHTELVNNLKMLNYEKPVPSLGELHIDIFEKGYFGATCLMFIMFICKLNSEKEISIDQMFKGGEGSEELMEIIYSNEIYSKACKKWLPFLNRRGFLDSML